MNINKEQIDDLNVVVSVQIGNDDYGNKVNEILRDYRRKANMPGFRPGMVPEGLIRKKYGKAVLIDEINKLVSETLQNYIKEQELKLLGEPIPKISGDDLDWEIGNDFTFDFDMGLAPVIEVNLSKEDQFIKCKIVIDQTVIDSEVESYLSRYGKLVDADAVADFSERLTGDIVELDGDGQPLQDSLMFAEDSTLLLSLIKVEERKKPFENAKAGDEIVFNLSETFPNDWEITSILKKKEKSEVGDISDSLFRFTVKTIQKFVNAELDQELFDKVFGEGVVTSIEEFENRIRENISWDYEESCFSKFSGDVSDYFLEKINPSLPEEFLAKWLKTNNQELSEEIFEKEFPLFLKKMKQDLISNAIVKENDLKIEEKDIIDFAKTATRRQFNMYGLRNLPDETLTSHAMNLLKDEKSVRNIASQAIERKVIQTVSELADVTIQEMSLEKFNQMMNELNNKEDEEYAMEEAAEEVAEVGNIEDVEIVEEIAEITESEETDEVSVVEENEETESSQTEKK